LGSDKWFVELVRRVSQTQTADEAIWHIFIQVEVGRLKAEDTIRVHERVVEVTE